MTLCAGVMGSPISHSLSPRLHGYWIKKYNLDASYTAWEVKPEKLMATIEGLKQDCATRGDVFRGCNLTIPLKETIVEQVDELEDAAQAIGAVNTVVLDAEGRLAGRNTDGIGFTDNLAAEIDLGHFAGGTALVLGAGGAARAILYALNQMGFAKILLVNRTRARAETLAKEMQNMPIEVADWDLRAALVSQADLIVNTTSLGMRGQAPLDISLQNLKAGAVVTDIVYTPLETDLLKNARAKGHIAIDGLGMLLHQAKAGFEAWFGVKPEVDEALRTFVLEGLNGD